MNKQDWTYKKLGEVGDVVTGSTPSTKDEENYNSDDICFVKPSDLPKEGIGLLSETEFHITNKAYSNSRKLPKGSVLTTCIGIIGKVGILEIDATCNQQINAIIPNSSILSTYLAYTILSQRHYLESIANAPVVPIINKKEFSNIVIPVPPIGEQERIVAELDLLSGIIEKKKEQLKAYDQLAQSIFYTMFGDPIDNPKGWNVKKLGEICENCDSMRKPITAKDREQGEIPYYGASGIVDYVKDYIFDGDYLLISEDGANLIARSTPIAFSIKGKTWVNNHAHVLKFTNQITQQYVEFSINLRDVSAIVTGCAQPKLTQANLNRILISFPPLSLQQEFAEKVEAIERQKALVQQSIEETQTMFDYTMDKYFG